MIVKNSFDNKRRSLDLNIYEHDYEYNCEFDCQQKNQNQIIRKDLKTSK